MKRIRCLGAFAMLSLTLVAAPAMAADSGFYLGGIFGQSDYGQSQGEFDSGVIATIDDQGLTLVEGFSDIENEDWGYGAVIGYRFFTYLAVEATYFDLGQFEYNAEVVVNDGTADSDASFHFDGSASGPAFSLIGILPFNDDWEIYGRGGLMLAETEIGGSFSLPGLSASDNVSSRGDELLYGVGGAWHVGDYLSLRAEYTRFMDVGDEDETGENDITFISLWFLWRL